MDNSLRLIVIDNKDTSYTKKIDDFRKNTSGLHGRRFSHQEEVEHSDKYCSNKDIQKRVLTLEHDNVVGMVSIYQRKIMVGNVNVLLGGVGQMRVREDKRKGGVASNMMNELMKQLTLLNCDIALLNTDLSSFVAVFYGKYGFVKLNRPYTYVGKSGKQYVELGGMIAPVVSPDIFRWILADTTIPLDIGTGNW